MATSAPLRRIATALRICRFIRPVVAIAVFQVESTTLNVLSLVLLGARMAQSLVHIGFEQTENVATWRFVFFFTQIVTMFWMGMEIVRSLP